MQDKYILTYKEALKAIQAAKNFCAVMILINGEYYEIKPDTIPTQETKNFIDEITEV